MKLEIHERLAILEVLPKQGDFAGLAALRKAREIISFTQEELDFYEMKRGNDNNWVWDAGKAAQKVLDAPMEQYVVEKIRAALSEMEENQTLTDLYSSLYEKFIISYRSVET